MNSEMDKCVRKLFWTCGFVARLYCCIPPARKRKILNNHKHLKYAATAVAQWLRCSVTNRKVAGSIPACVSGFFIDIKSFRSHYGPRVDTASNRNEYQEHFLGGKNGRCVRLTTYHHSVPLSRNFGTLTSWNPLGLSRPAMGLL